MRQTWLALGVSLLPVLGSCEAGSSQGVTGVLRSGSGPSPLGVQGGFPKVSFVGAAAADILEIRVQTGIVEASRQHPYAQRPGDVIRTVKRRNGTASAVRRDGKFIGYLLGKNENILFEFARVYKAPFEAATWARPGNLAVRSKDDPAYRDPASATKVYRKSWPLEVARIGQWEFDAPMEHSFYLKLPEPLSVGKTYHISLRGDDTSSQRVPPFLYAPDKGRSEAVHVSQIGFRPDDPAKVAFVSTWAGSGGGLIYDDLFFRVIDQRTHTVVYEGKLVSTVRADQPEDAYKRNYNGADVYMADFSGLNEAGKYRVCVQGLGCSFPFDIAKDVWTHAFKISAKGFYIQRRSIEIGPPYSKFSRPRSFDPRIGTKIFQSTTPLMDTGNGLNKSDKGNFGKLVAGKTDQLCTQECWGGLMDAGDWDSRIQHLIVTTRLIDLFEMNPRFFSAIGLNIPESGNRLPDIIDEALFNLDHYRRMQTNDGGIRGGVESEEHPRFGEASWQESQEVLVYAPGIWSSYLYAAAAARTAYMLRGLKHDLVPVYQRSAAKAWRWAERNGPRKSKHAFQVRDARNYAAAALYRLTGEEAYHKAFRETTVLNNPRAEIYRWNKVDQREANWLYIDTHRPSVDTQLQDNCRSALLREADILLQRTGETGFCWAQDKWAKVGWGALTRPGGTSMVRAHRLTGDAKYLRGAILAAQSGTGANPLNMVYTTGVGLRFPKRPLHIDSMVTNQAPPPGLTLFGPIDPKGKRWLKRGYLRPLRPFLYPASKRWPVAESFWNMPWFPAISEYTVHNTMAENAYVWGYLAARR